MNPAHLHLLLNHIPIVGSLFSLCLLASGILFKSKPVERAGLISLIVVSLLTIPAFLTGEGAEEAVERIVGISDHYMEEHEELAEVALWIMMTTGALALIALAWSFFGSRQSKLLSWVTVLGAAVTFSVMVQVGNHGGKIRHSEIRTATVGSYNNEGKEESKERDDDD